MTTTSPPEPSPPNPADKQPVCFVVQGFGTKTDFTDGRVLNLDASYDVIKQAVESAGLRCQRADEIVHSGTIDIPMYRQLLEAELVIADLSTYNLNAAFELGVRYALKPRATIVVAETKFNSPFDVNHIVIRRYEHLGPDLGAKEARRFQADLAAAIKTVMAARTVDSPVYSMLPGLTPPLLTWKTLDSAVPAEATPPPAGTRGRKQAEPLSARDWLDRAQRAMASEDYPAAAKAWAEVRRFSPSDRHATQQLALATYRAKRPSEKRALDEARALLAPLEPARTNDPETLNLWGAIHLRLWERGGEPAHWLEAERAFARCLSLNPDHYVAAQLATLHLARAASLAEAKGLSAAQADLAIATRVWNESATLAQAQASRRDLSTNARFWAHATLWYAAIALGDTVAEKRAANRLARIETAGWMSATRKAQGDRLRLWRNALVPPARS